MSDHPIGDIMTQTMDKLRQMVDANTIVGTPITTPDGIMLIPISKLSFGFGCGGADFQSKGQEQAQPLQFGGGSGAGVCVTPVAFIVVSKGTVRLLPVAAPANTTVDRIVDMVPEVVDKISDMMSKDKDEEEC